jgi:DNA repair exonuclease SbcCD ATPase subunit
MNLEQAVQLLNWLDEEHRRDKTQIAELASQLTQQYTLVAGLNKTVQDLEERLARLQNQSLRFAQLEQNAGQTKAEVQMMLEQHNKGRIKADEEQFHLRQLERERTEQILGTLQLQIEGLQQWQRSTIGDHEAINRAGLSIGTFQRELEEDIHRAEEMNHRIQLIEEWVPRFGQMATEQRQLSERLTKERAEAVEAARRAEQQRARHMAEWAEQMKASRREVDEWITQMRMIQEQHKDSRKVYNEMQELEERLKQMEARLLQWQRLLEETRRKERDQLLSDVDKRWQQQLGEWQFLRDEWTKRISAVTDRVSKLEDWRPEVVSQMHEIVEKFDKNHRERFVLISEILRSEIELHRAQGTIADKTLNDLLVRIEGEKAGAKPKSKTASAQIQPGV